VGRQRPNHPSKGAYPPRRAGRREKSESFVVAPMRRRPQPLRSEGGHLGRCGREQRGTGTWLHGRGDSLRADNNPTKGSEAAANALSQSHYEAMRRTTLGKPDAVKPPVRFDEGRGWGRKLTAAVCLTPSPQPRLLYLAGTIQLDRSCLLDLLPQILRPSLVTGLVPARASLTPRLAQASASQSLPSQLNRPGLGAQ
jgi:hypothetical protein